MSTMMDRTPKTIMEHGRMGVAQWLAVIVTVGLNALDGFDVLSISFASPGIAKDWGLDLGTLGWVLSMELLGMAVGSITLGGIGDKIGRRATILICLVAMSVGMFGAAHSTSVLNLLGWRLLTGLGIGGMLAVTTAAVAEFASGRWRGLAMALMVIGYPIGGILGGIIAQRLLSGGTWHDIFTFGGWATAVFIPIVALFVPESPIFYDRRRAPGALEKVNRVLVRFGHSVATELTPVGPSAPTRSLVDIFKPGLLSTTILVTAAYFALITSFYFLVKWVPKILVDMGYEPSTAAGVLMWLNVGGATGGALFGVLATRFNLRPLTIIALIGGAGMIFWFGSGPADLGVLTAVVAFGGFFTNSAICGMYSLFAKVFPTHVRSTGTGFAIGIGRGGSMIAPVVAGYLFQVGFGLLFVSLVMGSAALLSAGLLFLLKERAADEPVFGISASPVTNPPS
jgi:benzoate transport